jgi:hypothetical protein
MGNPLQHGAGFPFQDVISSESTVSENRPLAPFEYDKVACHREHQPLPFEVGLPPQQSECPQEAGQHPAQGVLDQQSHDTPPGHQHTRPHDHLPIEGKDQRSTSAQKRDKAQQGFRHPNAHGTPPQIKGGGNGQACGGHHGTAGDERSDDHIRRKENPGNLSEDGPRERRGACHGHQGDPTHHEPSAKRSAAAHVHAPQPSMQQ